MILIYHFGPIYSQGRCTEKIEWLHSTKALGFLLQSDKYVFLCSMILVSDHFNSYSLVGNCACVFALYSGNQCINPWYTYVCRHIRVPAIVPVCGGAAPVKHENLCGTLFFMWNHFSWHVHVSLPCLMASRQLWIPVRTRADGPCLELDVLY